MLFRSTVLKEIDKMRGNITLTDEAKVLCEKIYHSEIPIEDARFVYYKERRFTHLLKLSIVMAVSDLRMIIDFKDVLKAHTVLIRTEKVMSKALGEFGSSKYSRVSNVIIEYLNKSLRPVPHNVIWKLVCQDLNKQTELMDIMNNLRAAGKVKVASLQGVEGYLPINRIVKDWDSTLFDFSLLRKEERI